jgi:hypothetical protein
MTKHELRQLWYINKEIQRLVQDRDDLERGSIVPCMDGMPRSQEISDRTCQAVLKRERYMKDVTLIESELRLIPCEYQKGVWNSIMFGERYPDDAHRVTYSDYKSKFIFSVAHRFGFV